jgi:hypothetical protein
MNWKLWLHGLAAAFIAGGSTAVTSGISVSVVAPQVFNTGAGLVPLLKVVGVTFVVSGLLAAFAYLKQSPIPNSPPPAAK